MRVLYIMILALLPHIACSQAPGYMGKRLLITGEASFLNALFSPNHAMQKGLSSFAFNVRSTIDLDYVVARNGSVGFTFDLIFSGMQYEWSAGKYSSNALVPGITANFDHGLIRGYGYGVNYKVFRNPSRGGIAPIGSYAKFDVMLLDVRVRPYNKNAGVTLAHEEQFFTPMVSVTFGRQRIFFDFLVLRSGVQIGVVPSGIVPYFELMDGELNKRDQRSDLQANMEARLMSYYLINFNVGVGFLAPIRKRYK